MNRLILFICAASFFSAGLFAQSPDSALTVYNSKFPQEKLHIHFDKDTYLPGETVWMKAYLISDARPSTVVLRIDIAARRCNARPRSSDECAAPIDSATAPPAGRRARRKDCPD